MFEQLASVLETHSKRSTESLKAGTPPPVMNGPASAGARFHLRQVLFEAGILGAGTDIGRAGPPIAVPFGTATSVEGSSVRPVVVAEPYMPVADAAFVDGIQRMTIEGWVGVVPVVRAFTSAAVLWRNERELTPVHYEAEEFLVASVDSLPAPVVTRLRGLEMALQDSGQPERAHPMMDLRRAAEIVEQRRRGLERKVVRQFRQEHPSEWVVIDGGLRGYGSMPGRDRFLGVIKSHETQFLAGVDLEAALTLAAGERTTIFEPGGVEGEPVHSWYLRLWDWAGHDILHGLLRLERMPGPGVLEEVTDVSRWILAERAPVAAQDRRWDRLLYPVHAVETYLRAKAGSWQ